MKVTFVSFSVNNIKWDALYLVVLIIVSRFIVLFGLSSLNYTAN